MEQVRAMDPLLGAAMAAVRAVELALLQKWQMVIFETDSKLLWDSKLPCWKLEDLVSSLRLAFKAQSAWSIHWVPRKLNQQILVIFCGTEDIRTSTVRGISAQIMDKERLQGLILILQCKMNSFARKELEKYTFKVELFHITDSLVNITKHVLEPKYEILNAEDKQRLLRKWKLQDKQLPRMLGTDAIARYYGLEKGQVVKVTYSHGVVDSLETYRCVV